MGPIFIRFHKTWRPRATPKRSKNASATQARFFIDLGSILGQILIRRTPPGWRACQIIRINPVFSGIFRPPTPRHGQKIDPKSMKKCGCRTVLIFFRIKFRHQFSDTVFSGIFQIFDGFWLPFWMHFGIIFHTFCMPFSSIDFSLILYRFYMHFKCPERRIIWENKGSGAFSPVSKKAKSYETL